MKFIVAGKNTTIIIDGKTYDENSLPVAINADIIILKFADRHIYKTRNWYYIARITFMIWLFFKISQIFCAMSNSILFRWSN